MTPRAPRQAASEKVAHTLATLRGTPGGLSIYSLARKLGRPYRRVFDNVRRLEREGAVRVEPTTADGRRVSLVFANEPEIRAPIAFPDHLTALEQRLLATLVARLAGSSPKVKAILLFGSRARARSTLESDLDVAVLIGGKRDSRLEDRIVSASAETQWQPPFDGALRVSPVVVFLDERPGTLRGALEREGITLWTRHT